MFSIKLYNTVYTVECTVYIAQFNMYSFLLVVYKLNGTVLSVNSGVQCYISIVVLVLYTVQYTVYFVNGTLHSFSALCKESRKELLEMLAHVLLAWVTCLQGLQ